MEYASNAKANAGLTTGIIGTAGVGLGLLGNLLGVNGMQPRSCSSEDMPVTRYELGLEQQLSAEKSKTALLEANIYNDQKSLELYRYIDGKLEGINSVLASQAVQNQATKDSFQLVSERLSCCKNELEGMIRNEAEKRCCADNSIVNYLNATFYPKLVSDLTVGTTTTAQATYNPLPVCGCDCGC